MYVYPNIAKITFKRHELPSEIYLGGEKLRVREYRPLPRQCQNCWRFGHPAKHCRTEQHSRRCPLCAQTGHSRNDCNATTYTCANCSGKHSVFYRGCLTYKFETEVAYIRYKHGLTLREARQEARALGLTPTPYT